MKWGLSALSSCCTGDRNNVKAAISSKALHLASSLLESPTTDGKLLTPLVRLVGVLLAHDPDAEQEAKDEDYGHTDTVSEVLNEMSKGPHWYVIGTHLSTAILNSITSAMAREPPVRELLQYGNVDLKPKPNIK